jgi:23S rRNA (cytosine1962-C5)-methyltransferase
MNPEALAHPARSTCLPALANPHRAKPVACSTGAGSCWPGLEQVDRGLAAGRSAGGAVQGAGARAAGKRSSVCCWTSAHTAQWQAVQVRRRCCCSTATCRLSSGCNGWPGDAGRRNGPLSEGGLQLPASTWAASRTPGCFSTCVMGATGCAPTPTASACSTCLPTPAGFPWRPSPVAPSHVVNLDMSRAALSRGRDNHRLEWP